MTITVFTPTYNRAHLLPVLYDSLCSQTFNDFEWLIVDDGSVDNTEELVKSFVNEGKITISYFKKENGGKHRAVNYGVKKAKGELFFIVDSDDKLPLNSLSIINENYQYVKEDEAFAGVCGLKAYFNGDLLPGEIDYDVLECRGIDYDYGRKSKLSSDIAENVVKTTIMKQFPFPEYEGESFCAESAIWNPIGEKYKYRYFNKIIYLCEFLEDGLSANSLRSRMRCPMSAMHIYRDLCSFDIPIKYKVKSAINYWRFYFCSSSDNYPTISNKYLIFYPIGYLMHLRDIKNSSKRQKIGRERE